MAPLLHLVGARPNFMKVAPVVRAGAARGLEQILVHTGQHYDDTMSDTFFRALDLPRPNENLGVGSGTSTEQTARVMLGLEPVLDRYRPSWVVVYGDVNSTLAGAVVAAQKRFRIAHVEAGLRSGDWSMPEEVNRVVTDRLATLLLTPSRDADRNLANEGVAAGRIQFVGNVMIDTLLRLEPKAASLRVPQAFNLPPGRFVFVTLHRPSNVDDPAVLRELTLALDQLAETVPVCFAAHPRTRQRLAEFGIQLSPGVLVLDPLGYLETIGLIREAGLVLTDSGGLQEETTVLGIPCLTARSTTERPITLTEGTNQLVAPSRAAILTAAGHILTANRPHDRRQPEGWDGHAGERVIDAILRV